MSATNSRVVVPEEGQVRVEGKCIACGASGARVYLRAPDRYHGRREIYTLVRCPSCSLVWLDSAPPPQEMGRHYSEDYDRSVASAGKAPNRWRERWLEVSKYKSGGSVLDLGCSNGQFLAGLKGSNWQRYGIEMSETVAKAAAAECGGEVFVGDILDAPYTAESFDLITCFHVFEHLYQPREVLERLSKWLRPGGIFYTMMPNIDSAGARIFGSYWYALELPRHLFHFSPASLKMLAESAGLEEVSIKTKRELFIEASVRYILDEALRRIGIVHTPMAHEKNPSVAFRIIRKAFRLSALPVLNWIAGFAGNGESIHAVFRKSASGAPSTQ